VRSHSFYRLRSRDSGSFICTQESSCKLWNAKFHSHVHNITVHFHSISFRFVLTLILQFTSPSTKWFLPFWSSAPHILKVKDGMCLVSRELTTGPSSCALSAIELVDWPQERPYLTAVICSLSLPITSLQDIHCRLSLQKNVGYIQRFFLLWEHIFRYCDARFYSQGQNKGYSASTVMRHWLLISLPAHVSLPVCVPTEKVQWLS
jgi:hypothetical protein